MFHHVRLSRCCYNNRTLHIRYFRYRGKLSGVCDHKKESRYEVFGENHVVYTLLKVFSGSMLKQLRIDLIKLLKQKKKYLVDIEKPLTYFDFEFVNR